MENTARPMYPISVLPAKRIGGPAICRRESVSSAGAPLALPPSTHQKGDIVMLRKARRLQKVARAVRAVRAFRAVRAARAARAFRAARALR